jgi:hypothetical protein
VRSAAATAISTIVVGVSAAVAGVLLSQKFGRSAATDGLLAAYGAYLVLALAAQALRVVLVPELTRAAAEGRLAVEARSQASAVLLAAVPVSVVGVVFAQPLGDAFTGDLPSEAATTAGDALAWLVPAGFGQVLAGVAAAALAARDSYLLSALGFAAGGVATLCVFVLLADAHGPVALAWGLALNSAIALGVPLAALAPDVLRRLSRPTGSFSRLARMLQFLALPLVLQGFYLVALRLAAGRGIGEVTSLSYAYIFAAAVVAATASTLALISTAPLTRQGLDAEAAARYMAHAAWLSLVVIAAAAGVFALVGGTIAELVLGETFAGDAGSELARLIAYLAPWMVGAVAFSVAFPLPFVLERRAILVPLACVALAVHVALSLAFREAFGLAGIALALGFSTLGVLTALLASVSRRLLALSVLALARPTLTLGLLAAATFGLSSLILPDLVAAIVGLSLYALVLSATKPPALREAWAYVRTLH